LDLSFIARVAIFLPEAYFIPDRTGCQLQATMAELKTFAILSYWKYGRIGI